ncbi:MAG: glycosyltransferase family 4 protein [Anaerolineae bacterium]|nr:glycosyltransferase family 4 protein [Anaerolineae bacterium]
MRLAYLTMQMPVPSETFLVVEVRHLAKFAEMQIFCLRKPHPRHQEMVWEENVSELPIHFSPYFFSVRLWKDVGYWLQGSPFVLWHMLWLLTRLCWKKPKIWLLSMAVLPKSFSIARRVESSKIDIVHAAWGHYPAVTLVLLKKLLPDVHITLALGAYDRLIRHPMTALAANHAAYILTQNPASAELIKNEWPQLAARVIPVMRGIETEKTDRLRTVEKIRGLIVSSGRLVPEKGHQVVIEAFKRIHAVSPHSRLLILGEGPYQAALEAQIHRLGLHDSVVLAGHLSQKAAFEQMAAAEVFVLATEAAYENLPNVLKEAMGLGLPVVTTPTLGIETLIENEVTGYVVPRGDVEAIKNAVLRLLQDQALRDLIGQNSVARIHERFSVEQTTRQRLALYQQLLED